jgi:hypothetical protein
MPLIQQQKPKKLEVVHESNNLEDLPDINMRNANSDASRDVTPGSIHKSPKPTTPMKFVTHKKTQRTPVVLPIYEQ